MSPTDADLARVRLTPAYRAALWCIRLELLALLAFLGLLLLAPTRPSWLPGALFGGALVCAVAAVVLLRRAGYRMSRTAGPRPEARRRSRMVYRDVVLLWRTPSEPRRPS